MSDQPAEKSSTSTDATDSLTVQEADLQAAEAFDADEQDAATAEGTSDGAAADLDETAPTDVLADDAADDADGRPPTP